MKTRVFKQLLIDFANKLEDTKTNTNTSYTYEFEETLSYLRVRREWQGEHDVNIIEFNKKNNDYSIAINEVDSIPSSYVSMIIDAILEYRATPLEQRKDDKLYYIHFTDDNKSSGYLNKYLGNMSTSEYFVDDYHERSYQKTKFTKADIEEWAKTKDPKIIDWIIKCLGEEVEE